MPQITRAGSNGYIYVHSDSKDKSSIDIPYLLSYSRKTVTLEGMVVLVNKPTYCLKVEIMGVCGYIYCRYDEFVSEGVEFRYVITTPRVLTVTDSLNSANAVVFDISND